jgi:hypothetical protein
MARHSFILFLLAFVVPVAAQDEAGGLLGRVNSLRSSLGLPAYTWNGTLTTAAQSQAQWMVETGNVSHSRPDGSTPRSRAQAAGYASTFVSENIYGGTNATADAAWNFWINSGIHYAGLTSPNYQEIGIGVAHGAWGSTYVLVFGSPGGPPPLPPQAARSSGAPQQPSFVVGLDAHGNIMHEIQPGDTLGDIALIYGYTWDDIPYMLQLNGLTNPRDLEIGSILLVPPYGGTFTPTPGEAPTTQPTDPAPTLESAPAASASPVADLGIITPTPAPSLSPDPTMAASPTPEAVPSSVTPDTALVAAAPTSSASDSPVGTITRSGPSPWLSVALVVQAGVLVIAGLEYVLRGRRRK